MARILMVASEAAPFVKTGGLADVLGSLPAALQSQGHEIAVLLPKYRQVELYGGHRIYHDLPVWLGSTLYVASVDEMVREGVSYLFLDCPALYDRDGIYSSGGKDYPDNHIRFAVLSRAALEVIRRIFRAQIVHCHDWQTALVAPYMRVSFRSDPTFVGIKLLFTIHNMGYQGIFSPGALPQIGFDSSMLTPSTLEFWGDVNFMKGGLLFSDAINTVSPTYAREIQTPEFGFGLDGLLQTRSGVLTGILNGVDYSAWSPEVDQLLPANYGPDSLEGKVACKRRLLEELVLPARNMDRPLLGIVSRFTAQKGFDLISDAAAGLMSENVALAVLGSAAAQDEVRYEQLFQDLKIANPDRVGLKIGYDNALAHLIEAGADIFLMPSRYEPCGLNQMYSLRYGTPPVVRATGGLNDTIDEAVGFKFHGYSGPEFLEAVRAALAAFGERSGWLERMRGGMLRDYSWGASARRYGDLYERLIAGRPVAEAA
jgi:starch synthase